MSANLGRMVKWQDDGLGWHTGRMVIAQSGLTVMNPKREGVGFVALVQESCDGRLTWVDVKLLTDWQTRAERGELAEA